MHTINSRPHFLNIDWKIDVGLTDFTLFMLCTQLEKTVDHSWLQVLKKGSHFKNSKALFQPLQKFLYTNVNLSWLWVMYFKKFEYRISSI